MRGNTLGVASPAPQHYAKKPPFRAGAAPLRTGVSLHTFSLFSYYSQLLSFQGVNSSQQKVQEMNAWLRRKDYNPMKAAAEARKAKELKARFHRTDSVSDKFFFYHCNKGYNCQCFRSQNKGCLSVSVEDLLATAAEPARKGETLNEQLDRLSDAFDAVQRLLYLEQYSLDGHESPIPDFTDDASEIQSSANSLSMQKSVVLDIYVGNLCMFHL
uniref:Uncharacterized protein n=1 Tax=Angiostrongylus cantonensis TaxID=6313 RepID=A0A0K0CSZ0_ANGCA